MAAKKQTTKTAEATTGGTKQAVNKTVASKKLNREEAQKIVNKYSGINGALVPDELKEARAFLKKNPVAAETEE